MRPFRRACVRALACAGLLFAAASALSASPAAGSVTLVATQAISLADRAVVAVGSQVRGAKVYLNREYAGKVDFVSGYLAPGGYRVEVKAPGYRDLSHDLELEAGKSYSLHFELAPLSGSLELSIAPAGAELLVDGRLFTGDLAGDLSGSTIALPAGAHEVAARRFGYLTRSARVLVPDAGSVRLELELPLAPFSLSSPRLSRSAFNPNSAGALGSAWISFSATAPGSARIEIRRLETGELVAERDFPSLETWEQAFAWDGRGAGGAVLPDGEYEVRLSSPDGAFSAAASIRIDSSLLASPRGSASALPGSLFFPDPERVAAGSFSTELAWFAPASEPGSSAFGLGASLGLGKALVLGLGASLEARPDAAGETNLALSLTADLAQAGPFALAIFARGSWASATSPTMPGARSGIEAALPFSLRLGSFSLGAAPALFVDLGSAELQALPLARAGLWLSGPRYRAGLSAEILFELGGESGLLAPAWPAEACAEARFLLPAAPLTLSGCAAASLEPGAEPSLTFGLGLGFML